MHQWAFKISFVTQKGLFQHYLPKAVIASTAADVRFSLLLLMLEAVTTDLVSPSA
jgi:hypothetical protein